MNEYISREAVLKRLNDFNEWCKDGRLQGALFAADVIKDIPAADVQPVRRGKWLHSKENHGFIVCSQCKHEAYWDTDYGQQLFEYCPYCGAIVSRETMGRSEKT